MRNPQLAWLMQPYLTIYDKPKGSFQGPQDETENYKKIFNKEEITRQKILINLPFSFQVKQLTHPA